jgi:hypothetical protein
MAMSVTLAFGARGAHRIMFAALTGADERAGADAGAMLARLAASSARSKRISYRAAQVEQTASAMMSSP